jgi:hypothetical protein
MLMFFMQKASYLSNNPEDQCPRSRSAADGWQQAKGPDVTGGAWVLLKRDAMVTAQHDPRRPTGPAWISISALWS